MIGLLLAIAIGQCGPGGCPAPVRMGGSFAWPAQSHLAQVQPTRIVYDHPMVAPQPSYGWHVTTHEGVTFRVWGYPVNRDGIELISWNSGTPENAANFQAAKTAASKPAAKPAEPAQPKPVEPEQPKPAVPTPENTRKLLTGVDATKIKGSGYSINGRIVSTAYARDEDGSKPAEEVCLTVIGTDQERARIDADWEGSPEFSPYKDKINYNSYSPDHWALQGLGFATDGHPRIVLQAAGGTVIGSEEYYPGAAVTAEGLRKAVDGYDPKRDSPLAKSVRAVDFQWALVFGGGVLIGLALLLPRRSH